LSNKKRNTVDKRKIKKENAGPTCGARGQKDQLREAKDKSVEPGRIASSSVEPAFGQSMQEKEEKCNFLIYSSFVATKLPLKQYRHNTRNLTKIIATVIKILGKKNSETGA